MMSSTELNVIIYVLRLNNNKFYVGKTTDLEARLNQHKIGAGSAWTAIYPMIDLIETFLGDDFDEDKFVIKCMYQHGINNVRGGSYSNVELTFDQFLFARKAINSANNRCLICSKVGHFMSNCTADMCYRCGRAGHLQPNCYAKSHEFGGKLDGCFRCGRPDHWAMRCNRSADIFGRKLAQTSCVIS